ncbi:MAG: hemerythrin [Zetaproteobacteria bacterium]|nr:MAG: hemerythrin [Zetaproteobacteria bacterium]
MAIAWSEKYETGDPEIDQQHKQLFKYVDDLERHMEQGVDDEYLRKFLNFLGIYTRSHFCYEEICMRQRKCPLAKKNQEQHDKLVEAYKHYLHRFETEGASEELVRKLHDFLLSWLTNHILKIDTSLRSCTG